MGWWTKSMFGEGSLSSSETKPTQKFLLRDGAVLIIWERNQPTSGTKSVKLNLLPIDPFLLQLKASLKMYKMFTNGKYTEKQLYIIVFYLISFLGCIVRVVYSVNNGSKQLSISFFNNLPYLSLKKCVNLAAILRKKWILQLWNYSQYQTYHNRDPITGFTYPLNQYTQKTFPHSLKKTKIKLRRFWRHSDIQP